MSEGQTWRDQVSKELGMISGKLDGLAAGHAEFKDQLMGNGQPGIVHNIYSHLRHLQRLVWIGYGIGLGIMGAATALSMVREGQSTLLVEILKAVFK